MHWQEKLQSLGLSLPATANPGGNYVSVNIRRDIAYVAIQFPIREGTFHYQGRLGEDIDLAGGYAAFQLCALNVLAQVEAKVGMDRILGLNHIDAYYRAAPDWDEAPKAVNGASDLFVNVLGERGTHARAIFGVAELPRGFAVGLTSTWTLA